MDIFETEEHIGYMPVNDFYFIEHMDFGKYTIQKKYKRDDFINEYKRYLIADNRIDIEIEKAISDDFHLSKRSEFLFNFEIRRVQELFNSFENIIDLYLESNCENFTDFYWLVCMSIDECMCAEQDDIEFVFDYLSSEDVN
ncbi:MAG TPA: hypothetical protein VJU85_05130, partial [Nitrososphaeraceae archaeon]|nr:hypothetical protein [Nitrososphaeraceae archaeon]